ncbi:MAG TPA: IS1595 family transposase [Syntrophorhabdaceae bacterium]|nr:IS1595 family transposase [Syntrophorhabdaceae bacterium]
MNQSIISAERFHNEEEAYKFVESKLWPNGPVCPHCGTIGRSGKLNGKTYRIGLYKCYACRKPFTVKIGTIFEDSHIPLRYWLQAMYFMCTSKKGISANQLSRTLGVTLKTAWFMTHRIRYAMEQHPEGPFYGPVEMDETYVGGKFRTGSHAVKPGKRPKDRLSPFDNKAAVVSVLQRGGSVRSFHVQRVTAKNLKPIVEEMVAENAHLITDESTVLESVGANRKHSQVNHSEYEYVRIEGDEKITTNSIEGYFSILKRGINGVYHHCGKQHLHRYLAEFDFRYNNRVKLGVDDEQRADKALLGVVGKRLTYTTPA